MNSIIGPPYHVTSVKPTYGSIKGGTKITLTGLHFPNTRNIKVQFDAGDAYQNEETFGAYVYQKHKYNVKRQIWKILSTRMGVFAISQFP